MKFLEAKRVVSQFTGGDPLSFLLAMAGQPEPLDIFLRAASAERGFEARVRTLPFNTLAQAIHAPAREGEIEVFLLFPWDLLPEADWRSGIPESPPSYDRLIESAQVTAGLLKQRPDARLIYADAPLPPLSLNTEHARALAHALRAIAASVGARLISEETVSLDNFLSHGTALSSPHLGEVARLVVEQALATRAVSGKVLVTDFDNTLWHGVVGEDGVDGLEYRPQGLGFPHFIYQTYLKTLKRAGVLLAGVTKNDPDLAIAPLAEAESVLAPGDFIAIIASYHPKSAQLAGLAEQLNLGLESFVFVDDNPVEIAEVSTALPAVHTVRFPAEASGLPGLMDELSGFFHREAITSEDLDRTGMYRRMLEGMPPQDVAGSDLSVFLSGLDMKLTIQDRTVGDRTRAVQLINKTNQFNLNGVRRPDEEIHDVLSEGGRLITASLSDRHGSHGEVLACLVGGDGVIRSLVMSCRVFQRRVEHAFLTWLSKELPRTVGLEFIETDRNEPIRHFLNDSAFKSDGEAWLADLETFSERHGDAVALFEIEVTDPQST